MYYIRERWKIYGEIETHDETDNPANIVKNMKEVRKWIKDWIETWKENAEENEYKVSSISTDYKTFARMRIKGDGHIDTFSLKVVNPNKKDKIYRWKPTKKED